MTAVDLEPAKWLADHCDPESAFERKVSKVLYSLIKEVETLRSDLDLSNAQRSAAFRRVEELQDELYAIKSTPGLEQ